jgi:hypothetical protein
LQYSAPAPAPPLLSLGNACLHHPCSLARSAKERLRFFKKQSAKWLVHLEKVNVNKQCRRISRRFLQKPNRALAKSSIAFKRLAQKAEKGDCKCECKQERLTLQGSPGLAKPKEDLA